MDWTLYTYVASHMFFALAVGYWFGRCEEYQRNLKKERGELGKEV